MSAMEDPLDSERRLTAGTDVVVTELDEGEAVLLHLGSRRYFTLNSSGLRIWRHLESGLTLAETAERLQADYAIEPERAEAAVSRLAGELLDSGLVEPKD